MNHIKLLSSCLCLVANVLFIVGIVSGTPALEKIGGLFVAVGIGTLYMA